MRCKYCIYKTYDWGEQKELCNLFGYGDDGEITENRKGEIGCRFNMKTIEKLNKEEPYECLPKPKDPDGIITYKQNNSTSTKRKTR